MSSAPSVCTESRPCLNAKFRAVDKRWPSVKQRPHWKADSALLPPHRSSWIAALMSSDHRFRRIREFDWDSLCPDEVAALLLSSKSWDKWLLLGSLRPFWAFFFLPFFISNLALTLKCASKMAVTSSRSSFFVAFLLDEKSSKLSESPYRSLSAGDGHPPGGRPTQKLKIKVSVSEIFQRKHSNWDSGPMELRAMFDSIFLWFLIERRLVSPARCHWKPPNFPENPREIWTEKEIYRRRI